MTTGPGTGRCEMTTRTGKRWHWRQCKRNATIAVRGHGYCEQHAKMVQAVPADVRLSARDSL